MKNLFATFFLVLIAITGFSQRREAAFVPGELLLQPRPGHSLEQLHQDLNALFPGLDAEFPKEISKPLRIWLLRFNPAFDHQSILEAAYHHNSVAVAQSNHIITHRATTPNDANFAQQWQYINNGANGGVVDADIDAELAWDFTTGGVTPLGDTIVACIIDDGLDLSHPDFGSNRWRNFQEIPNNNLDDDGNGYVDDFEGWDADNNDDNVNGGGHGTAVAGIVGAKGNNTIGVTGVNWDVKLMIVEGGGNEAQAVAAYTYPLTMRKLWNASNGAQGAFVVVTNASWGTDFGQPSQAPLWCAIYDSLGKYGVLSCGATANNNVDVDVQGDLPTACPSDYLISVTNMNRQDNKVTSAGYGITTIDLGAHGQDAYTTNGGGGYAGFGGTSGATPHVTGAIALLYSAPCTNMAALAISHPDSAARLMKQFILDGTDPNASIANNTVSGGRLNLHGSILQLLGWNCTIGACYQAYSLGANAISDTSATLVWSALSSADSFMVDYRAVGAGTWLSAATSAQALQIDSLSSCTAYEFRVTALCDTSTATFSSIYTFTTDGCCLPPTGYAVSALSPTSATIVFDSVLAANSYTLQYMAFPGGSWTVLPGLSSPSITLTGLDSCQRYDYQVQTVCDTGSTPFGATQSFQTSGCLGCAQPYCALPGGDATEEWIANVTLGVLNNSTGSDNGYGDYSGLSTVPYLLTNNSYNISLTPGFGLFPFLEYFVAYIDYNQDGDFSDVGELAYDPGNPVTGTTNGSMAIPNSALPGITRMRVVMRYNGMNQGCGPAYDYGEVEDYCVEIAAGTVGVAPPEEARLRVWPNPFQESFEIAFPVLGDAQTELYMVDMMGKVVRRLPTAGLAPGLHQLKVSTLGLSPGMYFLRFESEGTVKSLKLNLMK